MQDPYNGVRSHKRKRQKVDKILNISIGIVLFLIIIVGAQLFIGRNSSDTVSNNVGSNGESIVTTLDEQTGEQAIEEEEEVSEDQLQDEKVSNENQQPTSNGTTSPNTNTETTTNSNDNNNNNNETLPSGQAVQHGRWQPIGTVQEEPFTAIYSKDHINWQEMTKAFQYATGLGDDITIWNVGNGGDHQSAVGIVADPSTRMTPYQVRIEWVANEGWMPVHVEQLTENPYISRSSTIN